MTAAARRARLTAGEIRQAINRAIPREDEIVVIYSGIWMFGSLLGMPIREVPRFLIDLILETLGPERTVLFPGYTYSYARTREFDIALSKPETGVLSQAVLADARFRRTGSPLNSYFVAGPRADEALRVQDETLWGDDSLMGWFDRVDARICVLGEPWHEACTNYHRAEEMSRVPYRYFKRFPGVTLNRGQPVGKASPLMYVRPLNCAMDRDFTAPAKVMARRGMILDGQHVDIPLESAKASDIVKVGLELLEEDPYAFVLNKEHLRMWVATGKEAEIQSLRPEERA